MTLDLLHVTNVSHVGRVTVTNVSHVGDVTVISFVASIVTFTNAVPALEAVLELSGFRLILFCLFAPFLKL